VDLSSKQLRIIYILSISCSDRTLFAVFATMVCEVAYHVDVVYAAALPATHRLRTYTHTFVSCVSQTFVYGTRVPLSDGRVYLCDRCH